MSRYLNNSSLGIALAITLVWLLCCAPACNSNKGHQSDGPDADNQARAALLNQCFMFERAKQYRDIYPLLSDRYRKQLPVFVKTKQDYESLRLFEEAYWTDFVIDRENILPDGRVSISGEATRWADRKSERAPFVYVLSKNTHGWYIDEAIVGGSPLAPRF